MSGQPITISAIICAYNAEKYISRAIESVLNQTYGYLEVIVVDDASTDSTASLVEAAYGADPRVVLVKRNENGGLAKTRMSGLDKSRYNLVVFLDADDVALPEMLEKQIAVLQSDPLIMGVATYAYYIGEQEDKILGIQKIGPKSRDEYFKLYNNEKLMFLPATTLCRKSLLMDVGGFRVDGFPNDDIRYQDYCDDLDLWCRMSDLSRDARYFLTIPEALFLYRKNTNSLSAKNVFAMQSKMRWIKDCLKRRRKSLHEQSYVEFLEATTCKDKIKNLRSDYAALFYKKVGFSYLRSQYLHMTAFLLLTTLLNPKLVVQKLKTQSRAK